MNLEEIVEEEFIIADGRIPKTELGKQIIRPGIEATKLQKSRIVYQNGKLDMESRQHNYRSGILKMEWTWNQGNITTEGRIRITEYCR